MVRYERGCFGDRDNRTNDVFFSRSTEREVDFSFPEENTRVKKGFTPEGFIHFQGANDMFLLDDRVMFDR